MIWNSLLTYLEYVLGKNVFVFFGPGGSRSCFLYFIFYFVFRSNLPVITGQPKEESALNLPVEYLSSSLAKQKQIPSVQEKTAEEFEEELQLAIALSQSEQEEKEKKRFTQHNNNKLTKPVAQQLVNTNSSTHDDSEVELNKFLARSAMKKTNNIEVKPQQISNPSPPPSAPFVEAKLSDERAQEHNEETNQQMNMYIDEVKKFMDIFITRMKSDQLRGRTITNDTAVQSLFLQLQQLHPKLLAFIKFQEDARAYYESLQDKLTQLKDAREALNALRYENFEKRRREAEERERIKQLQLNSKLADMRQKKHVCVVFKNLSKSYPYLKYIH
jgi:growth factor-regulated tyrosine kinase substrate